MKRVLNMNYFSRFELMHVPKLTMIQTEGETNKGIYILKKGIVKEYRNAEHGHFVMRIGFEGDIIGYESMLYGNKNLNSCLVIENSELYFIPRNVFLDATKKNKELQLQMMNYLSTKADDLEARMFKIKKNSVIVNFAELLNELCQRHYSKLIPDIITTSDIADLIGTTKNYIYKVIQKLEDTDIVTFKDRKLRVINRELLKKLIRNGNSQR